MGQRLRPRAFPTGDIANNRAGEDHDRAKEGEEHDRAEKAVVAPQGAFEHTDAVGVAGGAWVDDRLACHGGFFHRHNALGKHTVFGLFPQAVTRLWGFSAFGLRCPGRDGPPIARCHCRLTAVWLGVGTVCRLARRPPGRPLGGLRPGRGENVEILSAAGVIPPLPGKHGGLGCAPLAFAASLGVSARHAHQPDVVRTTVVPSGQTGRRGPHTNGIGPWKRRQAP